MDYLRAKANIRQCVVRLQRLDISKFERCGQGFIVPKKKLTAKTSVSAAPINISTIDAPVECEEISNNDVPVLRIETNANGGERSNSDGDEFLVDICSNCNESFDSVFEMEENSYIKPYLDLLDQEKRAYKVATSLLAEFEKQWTEESQKWSQLSHQIDKLQDKQLVLVAKNHDLRMQLVSVSQSILHDHNYARV